MDWATRTEGFVAEVAVVKASDGKHANDVHANTQRQGRPPVIAMYMFWISFMLLLWMRLMVLMRVFAFMTLIMMTGENIDDDTDTALQIVLLNSSVKCEDECGCDDTCEDVSM